MKHLALLALLFAGLLPHVVSAQFAYFEPGIYILASNPKAVQKGELKFRGGDQLIVKDETGKKLKFTPKEVAAFRIGDDKYVAVGSFSLKFGLGSTEVEQAFAQVLDNGPVQLLGYEFTGYNYSGSAYLLRMNASTNATAVVRSSINGGRYFRDAGRPFLASRPELVKYLDEKRIDIDNLPAAIYAINHNLPFTPPIAPNLD